MENGAAVLPVLSRLYAAAAAPDGWVEALQSLIEAMGAEHVLLVAGRAGDGCGLITGAGVDQCDITRATSPEAWESGRSFAQTVREGAVTSISNTVSGRDWERSAFYNEIVRPMNGFYGLLAGRLQYPVDPFSLILCRRPSAPDFDAAAIEVLQSLLPHLATSIELHLRLRAAERDGESFTRLLDRLDTGVILIDSASRPVFANARARAIAGEGGGLFLHDAGLVASTLPATQRLRGAIAACSRAEATRERVWLERSSHRPPLLLSLLPLAHLGASVPGARTPRIAIFITEPDAPAAVDRIALADVYRLTGRESDVAMLLADGFTLDTIAVRLGIGRGTVRSHLSRLFDKTGARSQTALVALVRGFADIGH
jgi:DNA-binding CsgD family transcriptional regulator